MTSRKRIQSIERAFLVLELFNMKKEELSLSAISTMLGLSKSTTHGIISTMCDLGYIKQNKINSNYSLGYRILELYTTFTYMTDLLTTSKPFLRRLSDHTNITVQLAVLQDHEILYLHKVEAKMGLAFNSRIGACLPAYCTGLGKAMLAFQDESELKKIFKKLDFKKYTENTITSVEALEEELNSIRNNHLSVDAEEYQEGLTCFAVPIFNSQDSTIGAISMGGPTRNMQNHRERYIQLLKETASNISKQMGYQHYSV